MNTNKPTENEALQAGYAAARLEIESLQARIKTMAEEHADELMVAHLDGRMRAAQPAGAQQAPAQAAPAGEPWHGHQFKEVRHGYWQCDCGKSIKEAEPTPIADGYNQESKTRDVVAYADKIAFLSAMKEGKGCDVWPKSGDYEQRTGRKLITLRVVPDEQKPLFSTETLETIEKAKSLGMDLS